NRKRQRKGHGAHFEIGFVGAKDGLAGAFEGFIDAVENGVILDFGNEKKGGLGNFDWLITFDGDADFFRFVKSQDEAVLAAEGVDDLIPLETGGRFEMLGKFLKFLFGVGKTGLGDLLLDDVP